jgi:hypothetical protein
MQIKSEKEFDMHIKAITIKLLFLTTFIFPAFACHAKNITQLVKTNTSFDEEIAAGCSGKCGNKGHSKLTSVHIAKINERYQKVTIKAYAKYHEHKNPPKVFGQPIGGGVGIKYTVDLTAYGTLDIETCQLIVEKVNISGDKYNLAQGAKNEEGKIHHWKNCQNFI